MYIARGSEVYYLSPDNDMPEQLFLTVHALAHATRTPEQQAEIIADMLNKPT